ncbi:hypothetical protein J4Q44_G00120660 [Coregonus suidteri]|uniref:Uncharacterized protein n=1 Tax=Coregonus suidteri TaxID=861788 RepID=A0AAN8MFW1_9TELE
MDQLSQRTSGPCPISVRSVGRVDETIKLCLTVVRLRGTLVHITKRESTTALWLGTSREDTPTLTPLFGKGSPGECFGDELLEEQHLAGRPV